MEFLTKLIKDDMKPALGVTEPGAIAYAVSTARSYVKGEIKHIRLKLNSGMFKNALPAESPTAPRWEMIMRRPWALWRGIPGRGWSALQM